MNTETEEKIKRDAEAYAADSFVDANFTPEKICTYAHAAGAKPWAEMVEELERAARKAIDHPVHRFGASEFIHANARDLLIRSLSKLREFRSKP